MKIKKISLPDEICSTIKESIKKGDWKPQQKIPSEKDLSEMFGVNRLTVRMALQKLSAQGIVETRVGEGTYVKSFSFSNYIEEVSDFYLTPEMIDNVCEFRKALENESVRLAMERASPEEIETLGTICDAYDEVCSRLFASPELNPDILEELIEKDFNFHCELVKLSKNTLYKYSYQVAREPIIRYLHIILTLRIDNCVDRRDLLIKACAQHRTIYQMIKDKNLEACQKAVTYMIDYTAEL